MARTPYRIDTHHHVVPPHYADFLRERGTMPGGIDVPAWSPDNALRIMNKSSVRVAILSLSTPGTWFGERDESRRWARDVNDYTAGVVADHPRRFGFFATLTLPDVDGAIAEAAHALDYLGADGVVVLANSAGTYLHDEKFSRLLAVLNERKAVVFIHPGELPAEPIAGIPSFTADFLLDTTRAATGLIMSGALERYPDIEFILAHAGGMLLFIAYRVMLSRLRAEPRINQAKVLLRRKSAVPRFLDRTVRRFWVDTAISATPAALPSMLATMDPTKLLYGSDYPFMPSRAVTFVNAEYEDYRMSRKVRDGIDHGNAERLLPRFAQ